MIDTDPGPPQTRPLANHDDGLLCRFMCGVGDRGDVHDRGLAGMAISDRADQRMSHGAHVVEGGHV